MNRYRTGGSASRRPLPTLLALLAALILFAAACSGDDDDDAAATEDTGESASASASAEESTDEAFEFETEDSDAMADEEFVAEDGDAAAEPRVGPAADDAPANDPLGAGGTTVAQTAADLGRQLIFTAFLEVEVDDVAAASAEATEIVEGRGGFLFGQNTSGGTEARSELIFKVLPADFNATLEALGDVGELRNQTVTTDDVTERVVDLESRIEVAELGVERLRTTLETTTSLEDFAEIERLLLARETELEVMRGSLRTLRDQIDLATITLVVTQDRLANNVTLDISTYENHDGGQSCPGDGGRSYENGSEVTVCFDIINRGDQTLTDITLVDTVLEIDEQTELITLFGSLDELAPGQAVLVAYEINPERDLTLRTRVTAMPTDGETNEPSGPSVSTRGEYNINTFEPDRDPGFGDGLGAAVDILQGLWVAVKVLAGFLLLPLLILVPLAIAFRRFVSPALDRRRQAKAEQRASAWQQKTASPPPPAATPATVGAQTAAGASTAGASSRSGPTGVPEAPSAEGTLPPPPTGDDG
ncbi:MAG: DUF4349 domain-containing protein [Actinomycetota bacterium]